MAPPRPDRRMREGSPGHATRAGRDGDAPYPTSAMSLRHTRQTTACCSSDSSDFHAPARATRTKPSGSLTVSTEADPTGDFPIQGNRCGAGVSRSIVVDRLLNFRCTPVEPEKIGESPQRGLRVVQQPFVRDLVEVVRRKIASGPPDGPHVLGPENRGVRGSVGRPGASPRLRDRQEGEGRHHVAGVPKDVDDPALWQQTLDLRDAEGVRRRLFDEDLVLFLAGADAGMGGEQPLQPRGAAARRADDEDEIPPRVNVSLEPHGIAPSWRHRCRHSAVRLHDASSSVGPPPRLVRRQSDPGTLTF